jgi:hypothetical protein
MCVLPETITIPGFKMAGLPAEFPRATGLPTAGDELYLADGKPMNDGKLKAEEKSENRDHGGNPRLIVSPVKFLAQAAQPCPCYVQA